MKLNRKGVTWAIAGLALAGALVGGAGIAVAATGTPQSPPARSSTSTVDPPYGHMGGMAGAGDMGDLAGMGFGENSAMARASCPDRMLGTRHRRAGIGCVTHRTGGGLSSDLHERNGQRFTPGPHARNWAPVGA